MRVLVPLVVGAAVVGCQGDPVAAASTDAAADGVSDAAATDAGPCDRPGNLVQNPSFENGGGTSAASWTDGHFVRTEGGADECSYWAEMKDLPAWASVSETIQVDAPAGAKFSYGFSFRAVDANVGSIAFFLHASGDDSGRNSPTLTSSWQRVENTLTLTKPSTTLVIGFNTNSGEVRTFGVDRVWVVRTN